MRKFWQVFEEGITTLCNRLQGLLRGTGPLQPSGQETEDAPETVSPGFTNRIPNPVPGLKPGSVSPPTGLLVPDGDTGAIIRRDGPETLQDGDHEDRWVVTTHKASSFMKVGRVVLDGEDLVLRSDLDSRGFYIAKRDLDEALSGGTGDVWVPGFRETVGTARLSASGRALNMVIDGKLYTVPLRFLMLVIEGRRRKVALFAGI
jgi:hypothetical protein